MCQATVINLDSPNFSQQHNKTHNKTHNKIRYVSAYIGLWDQVNVFFMRSPGDGELYQPTQASLLRLNVAVQSLISTGKWSMEPKYYGGFGWHAWRKS